MPEGSILAIPIGYMQGGSTLAIPIGYMQGGTILAILIGYVQGGTIGIQSIGLGQFVSRSGLACRFISHTGRTSLLVGKFVTPIC